MANSLLIYLNLLRPARPSGPTGPPAAHYGPPKNRIYKPETGPDDLCYHLVFFSTFEELDLPIPSQGPMEDAGVVRGNCMSL